MTEQPQPPKDDKDWTWTLRDGCPDCGYDPSRISRGDIAGLVTAYTTPWTDVLSREDVRSRPDPITWSPLEYACHVRDVCAIFAVRSVLMREQEQPTFPNWDQDETAIVDRYAEQDPAVVADELAQAAAEWSAVYAGCPEQDWGRKGLRSNGSEFTVESLGVYGLHDLRHHLWDVGADLA